MFHITWTFHPIPEASPDDAAFREYREYHVVFGSETG